MPEETETIEEIAEPLATEPAEPETPVEPEPAPEPTPEPPATPAQPAAIDIDAQLEQKEKLADDLEAGRVSYEEYAKKTAGIDRHIAKAQREMMEPAKQVQQTIQKQQQAQAYWRNWGKGQDVAQVQFGKVPPARAQALFQEVAGEVAANPRYQRREFSGAALDTVIYDKFLDALAKEANNKTLARQTPSTRASGSGGTAPVAPSGGKTARQRLDEGDYDLGADAQRLGMT